MSKQKFKKGDHVMIAKDLGSCMSHFTNDKEAIILYSYRQEYGGSNNKDYGIYIKGEGECAWYGEHQLTLIESKRGDLKKKWKAAAKNEAKLKSDLDWIFGHGQDVLKSAHHATIEVLASCLGCVNLWGSHGEGIDYYMNSMAALEIAKPFLEKGDKDGFLKMCKERAA